MEGQTLDHVTTTPRKIKTDENQQLERIWGSGSRAKVLLSKWIHETGDTIGSNLVDHTHDYYYA